MLTALAASGHLARDALCFVSLLFPNPTYPFVLFERVSAGSRICSNSLRALWQYGSPLSGGAPKNFSLGPELAFGGPVLYYLLPTFLVLCTWLAGLSTSWRVRYTAFRIANTFHYCNVPEACAHGAPATLNTKKTRPEKGALLTNTVQSYISHFGFPAMRWICSSFIQPQLLPYWQYAR